MFLLSFFGTNYIQRNITKYHIVKQDAELWSRRDAGDLRRHDTYVTSPYLVHIVRGRIYCGGAYLA